MAKKSARHLSKKGLEGLRRGKSPTTGKRVWFFRGMEVETLRSVVTMFRIEQLGLKT